MTEEEAIVILQKIKPVPYRGDGKSTTHLLQTMALDMAIAALKAEPCEDTISRKHLLSGIDELMQSPWFNNGKDDDLIVMRHGYTERKEAVEIVRDLCVKAEPPITPARKTGDFTRQELEDWLYSICLNNVGTDFCKDIEEIISRLDGFERYVKDMREEGTNEKSIDSN